MVRDKRFVLALAVLAICALALVGCGSEEEADEVSTESSGEKVLTAGDVFVLPEVDAAANKTGWALVQGKCVACHPIDDVNGARKDWTEWEGAVNHMVTNGAKLSAEERAAVLEYLGTREQVAAYGPSTLQQECMVCHTTERVNAAALDWAGWETAVDHMVTNGAAIDDGQRAIIVEWLAIRGPLAQ